jgi:hypothetical protein
MKEHRGYNTRCVICQKYFLTNTGQSRTCSFDCYQLLHKREASNDSLTFLQHRQKIGKPETREKTRIKIEILKQIKKDREEYYKKIPAEQLLKIVGYK